MKSKHTFFAGLALGGAVHCITTRDGLGALIGATTCVLLLAIAAAAKP